MGYMGEACAATCPMGNGELCSGHGLCRLVNQTVAACDCATSWGTANCGRRCALSAGFGGALCGGHGLCEALTGQCRYSHAQSCSIALCEMKTE